MKKLLYILCVSALLLTSCTNSNIPEEAENINTLKIEDFFPLTANTKYTYDGEGNEFTSYTVYTDYINDNRIQTRTTNSGSEIVKIYELRNGELTELFSRGETYFRENFTDREYSGGKTLLKEPIKEGVSWSTDENSITTITDISKEVVTPQGNIKAVEVTTENNYGIKIEYYAKDKGLVKIINDGEGYKTSSALSATENNVPFIQTITLFYPDIDGINLKTIDVQVSFNTNDEAKDIIEQTIKDLSVYEILNKNTKINNLYFDEEENSVHLDLSKEFTTEMNAGAGIEGLILQSVANTLGTYYGVQNIFLTIDGEPYESGHILLNEGEPLTTDYSNIKVTD